jgi:hypothetical protein
MAAEEPSANNALCATITHFLKKYGCPAIRQAQTLCKEYGCLAIRQANVLYKKYVESPAVSTPAEQTKSSASKPVIDNASVKKSSSVAATRNQPVKKDDLIKKEPLTAKTTKKTTKKPSSPKK